MDILVGPVVDLLKCLYVPFKRHCGYLCCYAKNVKELEDEVEFLQTQREDMNKKLDEESRSNMTPQQVVKKWKVSVDKAVEEADILSRQMKEDQRCLMGWCPNLRWRHGVGKKASKQIDQVQKLKESGDHFLSLVTISHPRPPADVEEIRSGDEFVATEGATKVMEQVMDALGDDNVRYIGIHGMGGIGKTSLVKNINNKLKGSGLFDKVVMVTVSQNQNLNVIQDQIADRLGMKLDHKDNTTAGINYLRANRLLEMFRKLKSVLIILDDVWTELKVVELGLPRKNEHDCCKIIVTTRNRQVCDQMGMEKEFEVRPLSYNDSWVLFESKVGDISKNQKLLEVGEDIVKECGGCPLAIVTLGSTLAQEEEEYMWLDALRRLRSSEPTQLDGIISPVITSIKFSYDHLKEKGMKFCFLFCSLFPEDYNISLEDLKFFGIGEGFLGVDAKVQLMAYIKRLKNCSLLLEGFTENYVKMHDIVRLTALSIASKEGQGFLEKTQLGLTHWSRLDNEEECKRLSLIHNYSIKALPESSNFPQLRTLLLRDCHGIAHIPNNFFVGMDALVNLDLSMMSSLIRWPKSISLLTNLRSLLLGSRFWHPNIYKMGITPFDVDLGKLKNLEVLVIYGQVPIPVEFAELGNLKILKMDEVHLELIPANVISRLHNLEELYLAIRENFRKKEDGNKGSLVEVAALKRLTVLQVRVREEEVLLFQDYNYMMPNSGWGHELQEFKIVCESNLKNFDFFESGNTLVLGKLPEVVPQWIICLIQKVECLHLKWRPDLKKVLYLDTLPTLKQMGISNCSTISQIASIEEEEAPLSVNVLGRLEKLQLVRLSNLENIICQGPQYLNITESFVMNLRVLEVTHCCKLVTLLPPNLLQALVLLEKLNVENCEAMRHIFGTSTAYQGSSCSSANNYDLETRNCLEHLLDLRLENMPNLVRICDGPIPDGFLRNLKRIIVKNCGKLTLDVFAQDLVPPIENTKDIRAEKSYSLDDKDDHRYYKFPSLEKLYITKIEKMDTLISLRLDRPGSSHLFQNLTRLHIEKCPTLKSICSFDSTSSTGSTTAYSQELHSCHEHHFLPQLRDLFIKDLPNLVNICDGPVCFASRLMWVNVESCGKLERVFSLSNMVQHGFRNLRILNVSNCVKMKAIFIEKDGEEEEEAEEDGVVPPILLESCLLPQLHSLKLRDLPELLSFCSWDRFHWPIFNPSLSDMLIENCPKLGHYIRDYQEPHYQSIQHREQYEVQAPNYVSVLFGNAAISNPNPPYFPMIQLLGTENNLKELSVGGLSEIQHVFWLEKEFEGGGNIKHSSIFTKLETLSLHRLEKLDSIWTGSNPLNIGGSSFQNLMKLEVDDCHSLRYLFSPLLAKHLPHLETLEVKSCERLEKLILISDGEEESTSAAGRIWTTAIEDVLPQLKYLHLRCLPELTSVFSVETICLQFPSLVSIRVYHCSKLKHLSLGPNSCPLLEEIRGTLEWLQALEEEMTTETKSGFKSLFQVDAK